MSCAYRLFLLAGVALFAMSGWTNTIAVPQPLPAPVWNDCLNSWSCAPNQNLARTCTFTAGRVPTCKVVEEEGKTCNDQAVGGYVCQGLDANNGTCTTNYFGCQ